MLVDEFQDTSRAQWELVAQLVRSWGEGLGAAADALPPSIFIVGDRKQSIYGFRDADVAVLDEAAAFIGALRPDGDPAAGDLRQLPGGAGAAGVRERRVRGDCRGRAAGPERERDRVPVRRDAIDFRADAGRPEPRTVRLNAGAADARTRVELHCRRHRAATPPERVADEIVRLLGRRDRPRSGDRVAARAQPADIAILFRSRDSHREFEKALERRGVPTYVYKGLGFFEADEIQDAVALLRYLADPLSDLRAAALLRSRIVRLSDAAVARLAPDIAEAHARARAAAGRRGCSATKTGGCSTRLRRAVPRWLSLGRSPDARRSSSARFCARRRTPSRCAARAAAQARENLKKLRGMVRRFQNRGYATLARVADHLDSSPSATSRTPRSTRAMRSA